MIDSGRHCTFKALLKKIRASLCLAQIRINRCDKHAATFNGMDSGAATSLPQLRPSSSVIAAKMALESSPALRFFRITVQSSFSRNPRGGNSGNSENSRNTGRLRRIAGSCSGAVVNFDYQYGSDAGRRGSGDGCWSLVSH